MSNTITFNPNNYKKLRQEYNKAVESKKESFFFEGNEFLTDYAKYVLEYLKLKFN